VVEDTEAALQAVIDGDTTLAVLPWDERVGEWLGMMIGAAESGLRTCFALPFVRAHAGVGTAAVAVGRVESEPTGSDRSVLAIDHPTIEGREALAAAARQAGLEPLDGHRIDCAAGPLWVLEVAGRPEAAEATARLRDALGTGAMRVVMLGAYAEPIVLSSEEKAGA